MRVIQHQDPLGQTLVARVPSRGTQAIEFGSQLIVEESQQAVFLRDGKALDTLGPGRHTLATQNLPLLTRLPGIPARIPPRIPPPPRRPSVTTAARSCRTKPASAPAAAPG
jgi:membrane protease subunit (stomatin/prohibitin family)